MKTKLLSKNAIKMLSMTVFLFMLLFTGQQSYAQTITNNTQGTHDGFFYSFWNDGQRGSASMTLGPEGNYSTTWSNINNFTAGKGWKVGKVDRTVCFEGSYNGGSNGFLAVYGWTKDPLIEYYVVESYGNWTPPGNTSDIISKGSFSSDGGTYNIYVSTRTDKPSIIGNATFQQFWSVRTTKRSTGTVTFKNHVDKWRSLGMNMGTTWDYQIMESEGYQSSGSSNITVKECSSCSTPAPTVSASVVTYEQNSTATQLTATGTSLKWYTVESGGSALSSAPTPNTSTLGTTTYYVGQTMNNCEGPRVSVTVNVVKTYSIYKVSSPIAIDGTVDPAWNHASVLSTAATKLLSGTVSNSADLSGNAKVLWDDTYLYFLADVSDESKINESANVYDDDGVEFYVDINNDKATAYGANDVQYTFGWDNGTTVGVLPSGRPTTGITYSAVVRTGGYIVEARIPWSTLQGNPAIGQLLGIDFMINDDDNNGERDGKLSWNAAADNAWQDPSLFGTAKLQGLLPCTTPAPPAVTSSVTYCQQASATLLSATGTGLLWYTSATGGTGTSTAPLPLTTSNGTTRYYVSQNVNGCESSRAIIEVTVNALPSAPTVTTPVTYCQNATSTTLTATGNGLKWYTAASGGTVLASAPTPSTSSTGTTNYYVSQTNNGCESARALIAVTVNALPSAPTGTSSVTYCQNATAIALTAAGNGLKWYTAASGGTALASAPTPSTSSTGTTNYYVSQTNNGCESARALIAVTVNTLPSAPTVTTPVTYCQNATATALTATGNGLKWYAAASGGTALASAPTPSTSSTGTTNYYVSQTNNGCESARALIAVTVNTLPSAPTGTSSVTYCQNATASVLTANGTSLKWYAAASGGTALASAPTPSTSSSGTTNYYVSQTSNGCESDRALISVIVNALPSAPTGTSPVSYCQNATVSVLTANGTSLKWYAAASGGTALASAPTPSTSSSGTTNYYVSQTSNGCESARALISVTVNALPSAPTVTSPVSYCQNASAAALTATGTSLLWYTASTGGTGSATAPIPSTTTIGTATYYVSQTTNGCESAKAEITVNTNSAATATITAGGSTTFCQGGSVMLTANTGSSYSWMNGTTQVGTNATYTANASGNYTVQITNPSGCTGQVTSSATVVTVNAIPSAPTVTSPVSYCQDATAAVLTANGTSLKWYTAASGGASLASAPTPSTSSSGTTNYYVSQTTNGCEGSRAIIEVTVNAIPIATITPSGSTTFVAGGSVDLQANTGLGLVYQWYKENTQVGTGANYTATEAGSYTVEVTNEFQCKAISQAILVSENSNQPSVITLTSPAPNTTIVGSITITVNVSDSDGGITLVEFLDGTNVIGTSTTSPYSFVWDNPGTGDHSVSVRVTDSNGGVTTSSPTTITSGVTGIWSSVNSIHADVYPNPANGEVFIDSDMNLSNASISLVDVLGKEAVQTWVATGNGLKVDVSRLHEGIYILIIKQGNSILQKKITVKR